MPAPDSAASPAVLPAARSWLGGPARLCWRGLRGLTKTVAALLALLLGLLVLAWCVLHWFILPHANDWRPWLEKEASRALGVELRIGSMAVDTGAWLPRLELIDLRVLDARGRVALGLPRVSAVLSAQSVLVMEPRFAQLLVDTPEVEIRRDVAGRLFIAGLDVAQAEKAEASGAAEAWMDWLFSQPELVVLHGRVRWIDEKHAAERHAGVTPLELDDLNLVLRNSLRRHAMRLDATPPAAWGQRFSVRGQFSQSLLQRPGDLNQWSGQLWGELPRADLRELRRHVDLPFELSEGDGALRAWMDIKAGQPTGATLDVALRSVRLRLFDGAPELDLAQIEGRMELARKPGELSLQARKLGFVSGDGVVWPRSDWGVRLQLAEARAPQAPASVLPGVPQVVGGEVNAERLDFALMAQIARRLPVGEKVHQSLAELAPQGVLNGLSAQWQGSLDAPRSYRVQARVDGLAIAAKPSPLPEHVGRPGVKGARLQIDANEHGGQAQLEMAEGTVELPGLFEQPVVPVLKLQTQLSWRLPGPPERGKATPEWDLKLTGLQLQTPDFSGEFDAHWHRPAAASGPGSIDLTGKIARVDAVQVARYFPVALPNTRSYLSRALLAGAASNVNLRLRGDLADFPFTGPKSTGIFHISTEAQGVQLAYVPPAVAGGVSNWPALESIDAELVFDRASMLIRNGRTKVFGYELNNVNGGIKDLTHKRLLELDGAGRGPGAELLRFVRGSPLDEWLGHSLNTTTAAGPVNLKLALALPLEDIDNATIKGQVQLGGVDLRLRPDLPLLANARAKLDFDRRSLAVAGTARLLGGDVSIDGGSQPGGSLRFGVQGVASAEALRRASEFGSVARLAQAATGQAAYRLQLAVNQGQTEISLVSNLQGLALDLPAPARKEADATLPLRLLLTPTAAGRDEVRVELGTASAGRAPLLQAQLQRDVSGAESRVLRGAVAVQDKLPPLPASGVNLQANVAQLDLDAWQARLSQLGKADGSTGGEADWSHSALLPSQLGLRTPSLRLSGRTLTKVNANIARSNGPTAGELWRLNLDAEQLAGVIELRGVQGSQIGQVHARLARLSLPRQEAESVSEIAGELLDQTGTQLPGLDIVVDDFELRGKRMGRLEVLAQGNAVGREWKLDRLRLASPDATLNANGTWAQAPGSAKRHTQLDWKLDITDAGKLLERMGQGQVLRDGKGHLTGQIGWDGSPLSPHYPTLAGALNLQLETGTFLKAEPGVGRLLGVLSLQSLPRRLLLDFRDVFAEGFTFDGVTGDVKIDAGIATSNNIRIRGLQAVVAVEGRIDLAMETQQLRVVVVPELSAGGASLAYAAINPVIGLGAFLAQLILSRPLEASATRQFQITGTWNDPKVEKVESVTPPARAASAASAP